MISLVKDLDPKAMSADEARDSFYILEIIGVSERYLVLQELKEQEKLGSIIFTLVRTGKEIMISKSSNYVMYPATDLSNEAWSSIKAGNHTNSLY